MNIQSIRLSTLQKRDHNSTVTGIRPASPVSDSVLLSNEVPDLSPVSDVDELFTQGYFEARDTFRQYSTHFGGAHPGGVTGSIPVPNTAGDDLTVDYMVLPAKQKAERVLFISSGVHGSEAPAGSAMEEMFFRENLPSLNLDKTTLVMVHSYNPWGHLHNHRPSEDNRNANRNNVKKASDFENYPSNEYHLVQKLMTADSPPPWTYFQTFTSVAAGLGAVTAWAGFDTQRIIKALAEGQVSDPKGVLYAGKSYLPQRGPLMEALEPYFKEVDTIAHFDIHTGLGDNGVLHMINNTDPEHLEASRELVAPLESEWIQYTDPNSPGFYDTSFGDFTNNSEVLAKEGATVLTYTAEMGTLGNSLWNLIDTSARLQERHRLHFFQDQVSEEKAQAILDRTTELFNPQDTEWRTHVVENFRKLWDLAEDFSDSSDGLTSVKNQ